ncbi:MAG: 16S rRNA (uracil(1498)-N(3))-methyltransferase [Spirochaetales bacterium]|nr:16S rRNA (uracil(1498)-N(3))-methyltransferase [Spirochaetales bacterium]
MRVFILDKAFSGETIYILRKREINYLKNVLRLKNDDLFTAQDIKGNYYQAKLQESTLTLCQTDNPESTLLDHFSGFKGEFVKITVYQALCKGKKNEQIVRALTETGITKICFITSQFTQEQELNEHDILRLETIIKEAVQQSGAKTVPPLTPVTSFKQALSTATGCKIMLHQSLLENSKTLFEVIKGQTEISLFIGSEGGFSDEECLAFENEGGNAVLLKTNILRAENAGLYTVGAIQTFLN